MTPARDTRTARPRTEDPKGPAMKTEPKTTAVIGTLLAVAYQFGMPVAFIAVEVLAGLALDGWLAYGMGVIVAWNVYVLAVRAWALGRLLAAGIE